MHRLWRQARRAMEIRRGAGQRGVGSISCGKGSTSYKNTPEQGRVAGKGKENVPDEAELGILARHLTQAGVPAARLDAELAIRAVRNPGKGLFGN